MHVCTTQTGSNSPREEKIRLFLFNIVWRTRKQYWKSENIHEGKNPAFSLSQPQVNSLQPKNAKKLKWLSVFVQTNNDEFRYCNPNSNNNREAVVSLISSVQYLIWNWLKVQWVDNQHFQHYSLHKHKLLCLSLHVFLKKYVLCCECPQLVYKTEIKF